jgi:type III pantothenate kinase
MLLAVDIGNTNVTLGAFDMPASLDEPFASRPRRRWAFSSVVPRETDEFRILFRQLFADDGAERFAFSHAIVGSVVPPLGRPIREALAGCFPDLRAIEVESGRTSLPVRNAYKAPAEVGVDRLSNAVGGFRLFGAPLIVADIGTATTLDVVDRDADGPVYLGGVILPGPALAAAALSQRSAQLPRVDPTRPARVVGDTTIGAMRSGLYWGMVGAIDFLIDKIAEERGWSAVQTVATGGLSGPVAADSRRVNHAEPELTLFGFAEIWRHLQTAEAKTSEAPSA